MALQVTEVGVTVQVDTKIDLTGLSSATIELKDPDGNAKSVTATATGTPTDGLLEFTTTATTFTVAGTWIFQARVVFPTQTLYGDAANVDIKALFEL
jgi:hypothetical protein